MEVDEEPTKDVSNKTADELFEIYVQQTLNECDRIFTSEEGNGKYLDLTKHYASF
jgi:hypothetical protein